MKSTILVGFFLRDSKGEKLNGVMYMKNTRITGFVFSILCCVSILCCITISCARKETMVQPSTANADTTRVGAAKIIFQTLDKTGKAITTFREGENFILSLTIYNDSSQPLLLDRWDFPIANNDFFRVYQYTSEGNGSKLSVGKAFRLGANTRDYGNQTIPANSVATYQAPWNVQNSFYMPTINDKVPEDKARLYMQNDPAVRGLTKGRYNSNFSITVGDIPIQMSVNFAVE